MTQSPPAADVVERHPTIDNPGAERERILRLPNTWPATSFLAGTHYGDRIEAKLVEVEFDLARDLLDGIRDVPGAVVEFGVAEGRRLEHLVRCLEESGQVRDVWGFDSFEGLPEPTEHDLDCYHAGDFAASFEAVSARMRRGGRWRGWAPWRAPRRTVRLVEGWFCDTLGRAEVQAIEQIAYARIDGDLYQSAVESLAFLTGRLADGAILVFDDWTFDRTKGETRAFWEWAPDSGYAFTLIGHLGIGHMYMRVRRA